MPDHLSQYCRRILHISGLHECGPRETEPWRRREEGARTEPGVPGGARLLAGSGGLRSPEMSNRRRVSWAAPDRLGAGANPDIREPEKDGPLLRPELHQCIDVASVREAAGEDGTKQPKAPNPMVPAKFPNLRLWDLDLRHCHAASIMAHSAVRKPAPQREPRWWYAGIADLSLNYVPKLLFNYSSITL